MNLILPQCSRLPSALRRQFKPLGTSTNSLPWALLLATPCSHIPLSSSNSHALTSLLHVAAPPFAYPFPGLLEPLFWESTQSPPSNLPGSLTIHTALPHVAHSSLCCLPDADPSLGCHLWPLADSLPEGDPHYGHSWNIDAAVIRLLEFKHESHWIS